MINLFSSLNRADDNTIAMQVALLQSVTLANITKPFAQKTGAKTVNAVKWLAGKFDKEINISAPKVVEVKDLIEENFAKLQNMDRTRLDALLREELQKRTNNESFQPVKMLNGLFYKKQESFVEVNELSPEESLSVAVIDEAGKNFDNIGASLTSSQKADTIAMEFHNRIRKQLNERLKKQDAQQIADMERTLDEQIANLGSDERKAMQEVLRVDTLTGKTVRNTLLSAGLPAIVLGTTSGLGVFVATTTIMHAVFTTMLGITLPFAAYTGAMSFLGVLTGPLGWGLIAGAAAYNIVGGDRKIDREMLSQCIYLSFVLNGRQFAPLESELAEWQSVADAAKITARNMENCLNDLKVGNPSMISDDELKAQISKLREEMSHQNELNRRMVEAEFARKQAEFESVAADKEERLSKAIRERDEIIERQRIENEEKLQKLQKEYEETIKKQNQTILAMRKEQDAFVAEMEKGKRNKMLRNEEINRQLHIAVNNAHREIDIISPWMNDYVMNYLFVNELKAAIARGVTIKIRYGIGASSTGEKADGRAQRTEETAQKLRKTLSNEKLKMTRGNEHSKLFICDDEYYVITSFNLLSFDGNYKSKDQRGEIGEMSTNKENLQTYRLKYFNF